jgi:hypothetical protein
MSESRRALLAELRGLVEDSADEWSLRWQQERELLKIVQAHEKKAVAGHVLFTADAAVERARTLVGLTTTEG